MKNSDPLPGKTATFCALLILVGMIVGQALAETESGEFCPTCPDWTDLDGWLAKKAAYEQEQQQKAQSKDQEELEALSMDHATAEMSSDPLTVSSSSAEVLVSPSLVTAEDLVLDISPNATRYIDGSINLNYEEFLGEGGSLKPISEIAVLLGKAGISADDSVVVTGECLPCGGGPSPAVFTYWLLKYLGHERVRVLDGGVEDWEGAGLNTSTTPAHRQETNYTPILRPDLLANYNFVLNGGAQIVDARPARDFEIGAIPGAVNIPYDEVLEDDRIRSEEDLKRAFLSLDKDRAVVVYSNLGVEASLVWFALTLSGYDARLYTWKDWLENQPRLNLELAEIDARPNPVRSGASVTITASFKESQPEGSDPPDGPGETRLTVQGCATCGFGSPQSFASIDRSSGIARIGSTGKASSPAATSEEVLRCTAIIYGPEGSEVDRTALLSTSVGDYMGIWNANVSPGLYRLGLLVMAGSISEAFHDVLEVEVTD